MLHALAAKRDVMTYGTSYFGSSSYGSKRIPLPKTNLITVSVGKRTICIFFQKREVVRC
ncbi:hypothetical protein [Allocoleopsis franciscana]|uniref:hypothetical protein n=1 Tax=Allocoleopsis franciscana TaxID=2886352 RepID=UPI0012DCA7B9|nr:hypothetical protein [Allocoleopsis franciscana]